MSWLPFPALLSSSFCPASFSCCFFLVLSVSCCCFVADPRFISFFFLVVSFSCLFLLLRNIPLHHWPSIILGLFFPGSLFVCLCPFLLVVSFLLSVFLWLCFWSSLWIFASCCSFGSTIVSARPTRMPMRQLLGNADVWLLSWVSTFSSSSFLFLLSSFLFLLFLSCSIRFLLLLCC